MKTITREQLTMIKEAIEAAKGSNEYGKYYMEQEIKNNGKWHYVGHSFPPNTRELEVRKYKDKQYIIADAGMARYTLTQEVIELIGENKLKYLRGKTGMNRKQFAEYFNIPYRTVENWENGVREIPPYLLELIEYKLIKEYII